jgi:hypothetical protein
MSKKILTALVPVAAIVAFMALPALAQATQAQCGASECASNAVVKGQSTNLSITTQNPAGTLTCSHAEFEGHLNNNQGETIDGTATKDVFSSTGCTANGVHSIVTTNVSTNNWQVQVQQPEASGQITAHVTGSPIEVTVKPQVFGVTVATCKFSGTSVQLMGTAQSNVMTIEGTEQFTLSSSTSEEICGVVGTTKGDLTGSFISTDSSGNAAVVHMS